MTDEEARKKLQGFIDEMIKVLDERKKPEEKPYQFKAGDIAINNTDGLRFIVQKPASSVVFSVNARGTCESLNQRGFEEHGYRKIGELSDPKVQKFFESLQGSIK